MGKIQKNNAKNSTVTGVNSGEDTTSSDGIVVKSSRLLINPEDAAKWYDVCSIPPEALASKRDSSVTVSFLKQKAERLLSEDVLRYKESRVRSTNKRDFKWLQTVLMSGTIGDKIAAHIILLQESAPHNLSSVDALIDLVNVKGKRECHMAMDALRDLFLGDLLPENRKLKKFEHQPYWCLENIENQRLRNQLLMCWYFEDQLKARYAKFINAVEIVGHDTVEKTRDKATSVMYELLASHPEQEQLLLQNLVNKLGDLSRKVAAKVCHLLNQLLTQHPNMKGCVVEEVEHMMYRPNIGQKAQYCALCFLNEIILSAEDFPLANQLVNIYFSFFKASVKKGEVDSKIMKALLVGVRRAYPYLKDKQDVLVEKLEMMYRVVHLVNYNTSIQALMLIFQVLESKHDISDRFYNVLYRKLLDKQFGHSPYQAMMFNLIYKALKTDHQTERVKAFAKRLLQVCEYVPPQSACGILVMLSELQKTHRKLLDSKGALNVAILDDDEVEDFQDMDDDTKAETPGTCSVTTVLEIENMQVSGSSWVHSVNQNKFQGNSYDPYHRNPLFARAGLCAFWELRRLAKNYHPTVGLFAQNLISNKPIEYTGDPLQDFTLIHFLDRFVYRNPKKVEPVANSQKVFGKRKQYLPSGLRHIQPNSSKYTSQKLERIPLEERFLFKYLQQKSAKKYEDDFDIESVASDEFEDYLDKLEGTTNTDLNFADEFIGQKNKKKASDSDEEDNGTSEEEDDNTDDDEVPFDNHELDDAFKDYEDDINEALRNEQVDYGEFMDGNDFEEMPNKSLRLGQHKGRSRRFNTSKMFAAAEEFSDLLDENLHSKDDVLPPTNKKQSKLDIQRNKWNKGKQQKSRKRKYGTFKAKHKKHGGKQAKKS